jgi:hypothetical protein
MTHRHILTSDLCVFCERLESIQHSLVLYQYAQEVWRIVESFFRIWLHKTDFVSTKSWLFEFLSEDTDLEAIVLAVLFWHI